VRDTGWKVEPEHVCFHPQEANKALLVWEEKKRMGVLDFGQLVSMKASALTLAAKLGRQVQPKQTTVGSSTADPLADAVDHLRHPSADKVDTGGDGTRSEGDEKHDQPSGHDPPSRSKPMTTDRRELREEHEASTKGLSTWTWDQAKTRPGRSRRRDEAARPTESFHSDATRTPPGEPQDYFSPEQIEVRRKNREELLAAACVAAGRAETRAVSGTLFDVSEVEQMSFARDVLSGAAEARNAKSATAAAMGSPAESCLPSHALLQEPSPSVGAIPTAAATVSASQSPVERKAEAQITELLQAAYGIGGPADSIFPGPSVGVSEKPGGGGGKRRHHQSRSREEKVGGATQASGRTSPLPAQDRPRRRHGRGESQQSTHHGHVHVRRRAGSTPHSGQHAATKPDAGSEVCAIAKSPAAPADATDHRTSPSRTSPDHRRQTKSASHGAHRSPSPLPDMPNQRRVDGYRQPHRMVGDRSQRRGDPRAPAPLSSAAGGHSRPSRTRNRSAGGHRSAARAAHYLDTLAQEDDPFLLSC